MTPVHGQCRALPSTPASAGEARRFVESALSGAEPEMLTYAAALLVSELVANAILHGRAPVEVCVTVDVSRARVEVHDGSPRLPVRRNYSSMSGTGRGLILLARMASRWGADPTPTGKVVWFELDTATSPTMDLLDVDAH